MTKSLLQIGTPIIHRCSLIPPGNSTKRGTGCNYGWHTFLDAICCADNNNGKKCPPLPLPLRPGYRVNEDGTVTENYWERIEDEDPEQVRGKKRKPYRIELVGVVCDAYLAVVKRPKVGSS